ncbi:MAG: hypothetical protein A3F83_04965 [Candidatus Glassbacteria bacterium RIFCSPLOWO2_12_FULL_58_11]|uniref:Uncharacterized protein n=1 Tax=Candidatus Glassbacteria bacterium RIFCSPLOWO2_12_FULL_58_11 TaxID=1817867 RepID=A0A1F5Z0Q3_9BACT|nr:MAG: hypothetical protein A3F83_04965 [Candidatus Glassbacteria bacterium RIFCSPLOWO2_12_FULL_58_11]
MLDQETLTVILAQVLTSNEKWQLEVERNIMLQKTIDDLFSDEVFQVLLENRVLAKFEDTYVPHFRAIELICTFRELAHQLGESSADKSILDRELEELMFTINDSWGTSPRFELNLGPAAALAEAGRIAGLYSENAQFAARVDRFRLVVAPLCREIKGSRVYQLLILENVRPPRNAWALKQRS